MFGGLGLFVAFFFMSKKYDIVVPPAVVAYATQVPFLLGLVGISYAILSSSWDPVSLLKIYIGMHMKIVLGTGEHVRYQ